MKARLGHCSLAVDDLDLSLAFYVEAFGCRVELSDRGMTGFIERVTGLPGLRCDLALMRVPDSTCRFELIAFAGVPPGRSDDAPVRVGHGHVCFVVHDLDVALARVERLGATRLGVVTRFPEGRSVYVREPGGSVLELDEPSEGA